MDVPYRQFEELLAEAQKQQLNLSTFIREGDEHFICYEPYLENPGQDTEFSGAILGFLANAFP